MLSRRPFAVLFASVAGLSVLATAYALGVRAGQRSLIAVPVPLSVDAPQQPRLDGLDLRLGQFEARLLRLETLGRRLVQLAQLPAQEFNFDAPPAAPTAAFEQRAQAVSRRIESQDVQLPVLETALVSRRMAAALRPDGRPVDRGVLSSLYGERADPLSGELAQHQGIDIAGGAGTAVVAAAAGVVSAAGWRDGYGTIVEITHGNGFVTRYAHAQRSLVVAGQTVRRGQPVALLGESGRTTGPHLHFEVLRDGRPVDPLALARR
ncbi:MAG: M23 family metallopeptidase [Proteobacteria bacterium]|nr:M23 family metallopeptidase [Pseudomonadota bacterium]